MREPNDTDLQEQAFKDKIACRFPYNDPEAATRLMDEARGISLNASFCALYEICSPPHPSPTTRSRQQELMRQWASSNDHPLVEVVLPSAAARIEGRQLSPAEATQALSHVGQVDGQLAALAVVLSATDDASPTVMDIEQKLRSLWST